MTRQPFPIAIILLLSALLGACNQTTELSYTVSGTARQAELSYLDTEGEEVTETVALPWSQTLEVGHEIDFRVTATRTTGAGGISCEVTIDEESIAQVEEQVLSECQGEYSCDGGSAE